MPKLEYFLVCESSSVHRETNRISLFNVVENIQPATADVAGHVIAQMVAVSARNKEPDDDGQDFQIIVRVHPPAGECVDFPMNFVMDRPRKRLARSEQSLRLDIADKLAAYFGLKLVGENDAMRKVSK